MSIFTYLPPNFSGQYFCRGKAWLLRWEKIFFFPISLSRSLSIFLSTQNVLGAIYFQSVYARYSDCHVKKYSAQKNFVFNFLCFLKPVKQWSILKIISLPSSNIRENTKSAYKVSWKQKLIDIAKANLREQIFLRWLNFLSCWYFRIAFWRKKEAGKMYDAIFFALIVSIWNIFGLLVLQQTFKCS